MIRGIVFDLDGTLWTTEDAYINSYKRIAKEYSFTPESDDAVRKCLGIKLDEVVLRLFPNCPDKALMGQIAVQYVAEYCAQHPKFCSNDIVGLFKELSKKYDLYIMSNCPRNFLDGFMMISGLTPYVKETFSISEGSKNQHLEKITNGFKERILFVGDSQFDYDEITNHKCVQFCYAKYGYIACNQYEYHIDALDDILTLVTKIERKERMIDNDDYKIYSYNDSNVTVINFKDYSMFGFIEYSNKEDFDNVIKQIKVDCRNKLIGPIDGKTWYSYRLVLDNFDWRLYPDALSNKDINDVLEENGFKLFHSYSSTLSKINEKLWKVAKRIKLSDEYTSSIVAGDDCYKYLEEMYDIATEVFDDADYYRSISFEDFKEIYVEKIKSITPILVTITKNNKLVAFIFSYEDPEKRFFVSKTIGIRKEERNKTVLLKLFDVGYDFMLKQGHDKILHHFQNDRTKVMESLSSGYEIKKKHFGLFKYENK